MGDVTVLSAVCGGLAALVLCTFVLFELILLVAGPGVMGGKVVAKEFESENRGWQRIRITIVKLITSILFFHYDYDDQDWVLIVEDAEGLQGKIYVSQETYDTVNVGDYYSLMATDGPEDDAVKTREK